MNWFIVLMAFIIGLVIGVILTCCISARKISDRKLDGKIVDSIARKMVFLDPLKKEE